MSGEDVKMLLAAMEDAAKKVMKYSRVSSLLHKLTDMLFASAALTMVMYVLTSYWQLIAAGVAALVAAFTTDKLSGRYYHKALREVDVLNKFATGLAKKVGDER